MCLPFAKCLVTHSLTHSLTPYNPRMQCNIDHRGRRARLISGIICLIIAVVLLALRAIGTLDGAWPWIVGAALIPIGAFQIYEARKGWCVMRAMGFKTPM